MATATKPSTLEQSASRASPGGVAKARLAGRALQILTASVDLVVTKSVLGGVVRDDLSQLEIVASELHRVLKPGGEYWFAENATASRLHNALRSRFGAGANHWHYFDESELDRWLAPLEIVHRERLGVTALFSRNPHRQRALAAFDERVAEATLPYRWRYILVGVARRAP